jgi:hypothetical protein
LAFQSLIIFLLFPTCKLTSLKKEKKGKFKERLFLFIDKVLVDKGTRKLDDQQILEFLQFSLLLFFRPL